MSTTVNSAVAAENIVLYENKLRTETNKDIFIDLKKNKTGVYLKITERSGGNRSSVLIPASSISKLSSILDEVALAAASSQSKFTSRLRRTRVADNPEIASRSIYVSGLPWDTTDEELAAHFSHIGIITSAVVLRRNRVRGETTSSLSMGCGVVEFQLADAAKRAVDTMAATVLKGRAIKCREDRIPGDGSDTNL